MHCEDRKANFLDKFCMFKIIWDGLSSSVWLGGSEDPDAIVFGALPIAYAASVFVSVLFSMTLVDWAYETWNSDGVPDDTNNSKKESKNETSYSILLFKIKMNVKVIHRFTCFV